MEIDRIANVQDEIIEALSDDLPIAFNNKSAELKVHYCACLYAYINLIALDTRMTTRAQPYLTIQHHVSKS